MLRLLPEEAGAKSPLVAHLDDRRFPTASNMKLISARKPLLFSILVNDFDAPSSAVKALVDRLVNRIAELAGP